MYVIAGMCSTIDRYCCSVKRRVSSVRCRSIATPSAPAVARSAPISTADQVRSSRASSKPRNPHQSGPTKTGTARTLPTPSRERTRCSHSGSSPTGPCTSPRRPSTSIQREKSGANGCRWFSGSSKIRPTPSASHSHAEVHPQPTVRPTGVLEQVRARHGRSAAEVLEHLIDPIVPGLVPQEALVGERDGTEDGLSDSGRSLHLPDISAERAPS